MCSCVAVYHQCGAVWRYRDIVCCIGFLYLMLIGGVYCPRGVWYVVWCSDVLKCTDVVEYGLMWCALLHVM